MWDPEYLPGESSTARWDAVHIYADEKVRHGGTLVLTSQRLVWLPSGVGRLRPSRQWECALGDIHGVESFRVDTSEWLVVVDCPAREGFLVNNPDSLVRTLQQLIDAR